MKEKTMYQKYKEYAKKLDDDKDKLKKLYVYINTIPNVQIVDMSKTSLKVRYFDFVTHSFDLDIINRLNACMYRISENYASAKYIFENQDIDI